MSELTGGAGMPDSWSRLWAPHRMSYLDGENRPLPGNDVACPFCAVPSMSDEEGLVVFRGKEAYVVMNLYPYNAGHVLVCAYRHVADLTDLSFLLGRLPLTPPLPLISTNMLCRGGLVMQTLCQSLVKQKYFHNYCKILEVL